MRNIWLVAAALLPLSEGGTAYAAPSLRDGPYYCTIQLGGTMGVGTLEIRGRTYRGPSNAPSGEFAPFVVSENGEVEWSNGFGEFTRGENRFLESRVKAPNRVVVTYRSRRVADVDCTQR